MGRKLANHLSRLRGGVGGGFNFVEDFFGMYVVQQLLKIGIISGIQAQFISDLGDKIKEAS